MSSLPKKVVISQSMYFPWVGLLEQIKLADIYVFYDDVQFTRGFYNRVQIKTENGTPWITVPTRDYHRGQKINEVIIDERLNWRKHHRGKLLQAYVQSPYYKEMLWLVDQVFDTPVKTIADISRTSLMALADYFGLTKEKQFLDSQQLGIIGASSQRLHDITQSIGGDIYITGHGAKNYLDHNLFESSGIAVEYMNYNCKPYPQLHGDFTPYVSALDLVANCGKQGAGLIHSGSIAWRKFI